MKMTNENLNDFIKQVLQKIKKNKSKQRNLTGAPSTSTSNRSAMPSVQMPSINKKPKRRNSSSKSYDRNPKQLDLALNVDKPKSIKPYTDAKKWLQDNFNKEWEYVGTDLTGYPTGLLPSDAFTTGKVLENDIYRFSILANPHTFMLDWNTALKQKLADMKGSKNPPPHPPEAGASEEDINVNELTSIIQEIVAEEIAEVNHTKDDSGNTIISQGAPGSVIRFVTENPTIIKAMKDWVLDCQWEDIHGEEDVEDMSPEELLRGIQNNYSGGIKAFINDSQSQAEVPVGYKESLKEQYEDQEHGDGYTNDSQRAFAHSQATTPRANETNKAIELAKKGQYVVMSEYPVHCKSTDACLGTEKVIHKAFPNRDEASKAVEKLYGDGNHDNQFSIVGPEDIDPATNKIKLPKREPEPTSDDNDVPFEGVGYVYDKDMKKDPKHIPGERWRVKFQENVSRRQLKDAVRVAITEIMSSGVNEVIQGYDEMIELIKRMPTEKQEELNSFVKTRGGSAYDAVLEYFEQQAAKNQSPTQV